jgi:hypothetical protein
MLNSREIMQILRNKIEEKKKDVGRPDVPSEAYKDLIYAEIETL